MCSAGYTGLPTTDLICGLHLRVAGAAGKLLKSWRLCQFDVHGWRHTSWFSTGSAQFSTSLCSVFAADPSARCFCCGLGGMLDSTHSPGSLVAGPVPLLQARCPALASQKAFHSSKRLGVESQFGRDLLIANEWTRSGIQAGSLGSGYRDRAKAWDVFLRFILQKL